MLAPTMNVGLYVPRAIPVPSRFYAKKLNRRVKVRQMEKKPRMIPNPLWCDACEGRGYRVQDSEWEPIAIQCPFCKTQRETFAAAE